ncbi:MAG: 2-amino-4-hydroxy-6-hydroxymethyldihydropteridine diphosphokinase [Rhodobacterales bacterium]|nr:2-amino-4-hydroxy-6-hydroxymethyldihydropteridine diphosphokinase [Rhodobacterales bacterium]
MPQPHEQVPATDVALIALGGNEPSPTGAPLDTLRAALGEIAMAIGPITGKSRMFGTPCFPAGAGPDYVNAAVAVATRLPAAEILRRLHEIEQNHGRARLQRWGMRTLDLDLLALGGAVLPDRATYEDWRALPPDLQQMRAPDALVLPHPRLQDRAFVLVPLADVAADWVHPVLGQSVAAMLAALPAADRDAVVPLD